MKKPFSFFFARHPDIETLHHGLIVLSCFDSIGDRIAKAACEILPAVSWTVVKREEPAPHGFETETRYTFTVSTVLQQWRFLSEIRELNADVTVVAWTNEPSYRLLQWLAWLSGSRYLLVFNENIDAFFLVSKNAALVWSHLRWRFSHRMLVHILRNGAEMVSWILLFPVGLFYLTIRTSYLVLKRMVSPRR